MRKIAREVGNNRESVRKKSKEDLKLKPYKLRKAQLLTEKNKLIRPERYKKLALRAAGDKLKDFLFSDEKLFTVEQLHNHQNDMIWSPEAPGSTGIVTHRQNPRSVMVWGGVCTSSKPPLIFIDQGVKVNQEVYRRKTVGGVLLPRSQQHFGNRQWTFQQDSAPAHKTRKTEEWCRNKFPDFISAQEWPRYSADLNPVDCSIWSTLESRTCTKPHKNLGILKQTMLKEWDKISVDEVRRAIEDFPKRLQFCIKVKRGHFEAQ